MSEWMKEWVSDSSLFQMENLSESVHWLSIYEHGSWWKQLSKVTFSVKVQVLAYTFGMVEKTQAALSFIFPDVGETLLSTPSPGELQAKKAGKEKEKQGAVSRGAGGKDEWVASSQPWSVGSSGAPAPI